MWPLAVLLVGCLFGLAARRMDSVYRTGAAVALVGHIVVAIAVLPRLPYTWDIAKFHEAALSVLAGQVPAYATSVSSFAMFQSLVYTLTGPGTSGLAVVNGFLAVLVPFPVRELIRRLFPDIRTTDAPTILTLFLPVPFVILTVPMRDSLTVLVFFTTLALSVRAVSERSLWPATVGAPLWGVLYLLRPELALLLVVGGGAAAFVAGLDYVTERPLSLGELLVSTAPAGLLGSVLFSNWFPLGGLNGRVSYRAMGSAAYLESFRYESWFDVVLAAPVRAIYFQFAPFPLHVNQLFDLLAVAVLPVLIVLSLAAAVSVSEYETNRVVLVLLAVVYGAGVVGYGLIDSNFGTTVRHRIPFVFLLVVFASPLLDRWWSAVRQGGNAADQKHEQ